VKQGFAKHFQNLNPKPARIEYHGDFELENLYHEKVRILNRFRKHIYRNNRVEMRA
jgi:hypothetical protein